MELFGQIIASVLSNLSTGNRLLLPDWKIVTLSAVAAVLALLAAGFLTLALYLKLGDIWTPAAAATIIAIGLLTIAVLLLVVVIILNRATKTPRRSPEPDKMIEAILTLGTIPSSTLLALLAGLAAGALPSLRRFLRNIEK
jgi:hypothetical protein